MRKQRPEVLFDVLVVGSGFSGLAAALFAARTGKKVCIVAKGQGALAIGGATVDVLGYAPGRKSAVCYPLEDIDRLGSEHPYRLAGKACIREALEAFVEICSMGGYPYELAGGSENPKNRRAFTCIGTMKPVCLAPKCGVDTEKAESVLIVGYEGLKDFYPRLAAQGLKAFIHADVETVNLPCPPELLPEPHGRDLSVLDAARYLDTPRGRERFVRDMKRESAFARLAGRRAVILAPPIFGSLPSDTVRSEIESALGIPIAELIAPPPAVTGLRLHMLLTEALRKAGVEMILNAEVLSPVIGADGKTVEGLNIDSAGRVRFIGAHAFVMASGGIYGGGINVSPNGAADVVFGNKVRIIPDVIPMNKGWSEAVAYPDFSAGRSHAFARLGVKVCADFRPEDADGKAALNNVWYVGRGVGGYDPAAEKSGNGVALVSAYAAVQSIAGMPSARI